MSTHWKQHLCLILTIGILVLMAFLIFMLTSMGSNSLSNSTIQSGSTIAIIANGSAIAALTTTTTTPMTFMSTATATPPFISTTEYYVPEISTTYVNHSFIGDETWSSEG